MDKKLLERFFKGECTAAEAVQVQQWLQDHPGAVEDYLQEVWNEPGDHKMPAHLELELRAALPLTPAALPETPVIQLHEKQRPKKWLRWYSAAAILLVILAAWWLVQFNLRDTSVQLHTQTVVTAPAGKVYKLILPDQSVAWLKSNARLQFDATQYGKAERTVELLEGEVFFEVQKDPAHPFVVAQGVIQTRVLGTTFSVQAATAHSPAVVTVATGKVAVHYAHKELGVLLPGKQVSIDRATGEHAFKEVPVWAASGWKAQQLRLVNASFEEVQLAMEQLYWISVQTTNEKVKQQRYTIQLNRRTPAQEAIAVLSLLNQNQYQRKTDSTYIIY